jgi:hypothetical protein
MSSLVSILWENKYFTYLKLARLVTCVVGVMTENTSFSIFKMLGRWPQILPIPGSMAVRVKGLGKRLA